ncbi:MAG: S8 family serine peptidase [Bacillota bacterium]|nr:S8 family serine peptidase [Bacillota bacterium]
MNIFDNTILGIYKRTLSSEPWSPPGVSLIAARKMWPTTRGAGAVVAVLDTGIDYNHSDLKNNVIDGKSFISSEKDYMDEHGHGTHVAGTIAANGKLLGVAPEAKLLAVKVLDRNGSGSYTGIAQGLDWVRTWRGPNHEKVQVVNMSLGGTMPEATLHRAITKAVQAGITIVCAAGNSGDGNKQTREISYPAYYPETLAVGAVDLQSGAANFSNSNDRIDVVAPGVDTYSTYPKNRYVKLSGTSMATPHLSGAAALIRARWHKRFQTNPLEADVRNLVQYMSIDLGDAGYDELYGYGLFSFNLNGGKDIVLIVGSNQYYVNGKLKMLQNAPLRYNEAVYAPVAEISSVMNCDCTLIPPDGSPENKQGQVQIWN